MMLAATHPATPYLAKLSEYYDMEPLLLATLKYLCMLAIKQGTTYRVTTQEWRTDNAVRFLQHAWNELRGNECMPGTAGSNASLERICAGGLHGS